jgi:hypothetical protein
MRMSFLYSMIPYEVTVPLYDYSASGFPPCPLRIFSCTCELGGEGGVRERKGEGGREREGGSKGGRHRAREGGRILQRVCSRGSALAREHVRCDRPCARLPPVQNSEAHVLRRVVSDRRAPLHEIELVGLTLRFRPVEFSGPQRYHLNSQT